MGTATYLIALGSNMRTRRRSPHATLAQVVRAFAPSLERTIAQRHEDARATMKVLATSRFVSSPPLGPAKRRYVNAVIIIETTLQPLGLLGELKAIERRYGRRPGRRWGARPLDLDIIAWSGGIWASPGLSIPHAQFRKRHFVLAPLCDIAPEWRDPVTNLTARHLRARLSKNIRDT